MTRWISIGDYGGVAVAEDRVYVCTGNGNKIIVFNDTPTGQQYPDSVIGAPSLETDTLLENNYLTNPVPASDGEHLFVSSDFDRKLYVWKNIPDTSGANPDITYSLDFAPWDNVVYDNKLIIAGADTVYVWNSLPLNGEIPDHVYYKKIGDAEFNEIRGVTMDDKYFYIADRTTNSIYVWEGLPEDTDSPKYIIQVEKADRINSDGEYLIVATPEGQVFPQYEKIQVYKVDELTSDTQPQYVDGIMTNLPMAACTYENQLFVADTCFSRVLVWSNINDALNGSIPDVVLGEENLEDTLAETGQNKLYWPEAVQFDGNYLWVGEFKFSGRLLRFSPH